MDTFLRYAVASGVLFVVLWIVLFGIVQLTKRLADLTIPEFPTLLLRTAGIAAVMTAFSFVPWGGWLLGPFVAGAILRRWFDADLSAAAIVVLLTILVVRIAEWSVVAVLLAERGR